MKLRFRKANLEKRLLRIVINRCDSRLHPVLVIDVSFRQTNALPLSREQRHNRLGSFDARRTARRLQRHVMSSATALLNGQKEVPLGSHWSIGSTYRVTYDVTYGVTRRTTTVASSCAVGCSPGHMLQIRRRCTHRRSWRTYLPPGSWVSSQMRCRRLQS